MAFTVDLYYSFVKKPNSTKRPIEIDPLMTLQNVTLNEQTDLTHPTFIFTQPSGVVDQVYRANYMYVDGIAKYYFIDKWTFAGGRWLASCTADVLATYKYEIADQRTFISRSAAKYNGAITDTLYPATNSVRFNLAAQATGLKTNYEAGTYVLGIFSGDTEAVGSVVYYALNNTQMRALNNKLMGNIEWFYTGVTEISEELFKAFSNPMQYISSCTWFPFAAEDVPGTFVNTIKYGYWEFNVTAKKLTENLWKGVTYTLSGIPKHPQASTRGEYLNHPPFSKYWFNWPLTGTIAIDPNIIAAVDEIEILLYADLANGKGVLYFRNPANSMTLLTMEVQMGVPFSLSMSSNQGRAGILNGVGSYLASTMPETMGSVLGSTGGDVYGAVFTTMSSALGMTSPVITSTGSTGSVLSFIGYPELAAEFFLLTDEDRVNKGRPYCKEDVISSCPGYIQTSNTTAVITGTAEEQRMVREYMNTGFYYE